jgi:hypothetical protein
VRRLALSAVAIFAFSGVAEAQTCRSHHQWAKNVFAEPVERIQRIEDQVLRRYMGGGGSSYEQLARETNRTFYAISQSRFSDAERSLRGCRNFVPSYRRTCADAAARLLDVVREIEASDLTEATRLGYAERIARCEMWLGFPRRSTLLRMP